MVKSSTTKLRRQRVDVSSKAMVRHWAKRFKKPESEIEAAVAKVGDNPETVMKQLGLAKEVQV